MASHRNQLSVSSGELNDKFLMYRRFANTAKIDVCAWLYQDILQGRCWTGESRDLDCPPPAIARTTCEVCVNRTTFDAKRAMVLWWVVYWTYEAYLLEPTHVYPYTGELTANGSTDKTRCTACIAHVSISLYRPFNELRLANKKHARSNQHPIRNARSSAVTRTMMIDDDTIVRWQRWRPEARSPIIYTCGVYYIASSESSIIRSTLSRSLSRRFSRVNASAIIGNYLPTMHVTTSTRIVDELADVNAIWRTTVVYMRNDPQSPCRTSTSIPHITPFPPLGLKLHQASNNKRWSLNNVPATYGGG